MGVTYQLISKLEKLDYFNELLKQGIVPTNWATYKEIYEHYLGEIQKLKDSRWSAKKTYRQAKCNTAERFNISERSVYLIVQKMEG